LAHNDKASLFIEGNMPRYARHYAVVFPHPFTPCTPWLINSVLRVLRGFSYSMVDITSSCYGMLYDVSRNIGTTTRHVGILNCEHFC